MNPYDFPGDCLIASGEVGTQPSLQVSAVSSNSSWGSSLRALASHVGVFSPSTEKRQAPRRAVQGELTALFVGPRGHIRNSRISVVNISDNGLAFRADWEFAVGQSLLISDGVIVLEVVIQHRRPARKGLIYGVEASLAAPLPARFARRVPESFLRLSEEMTLPPMGDSAEDRRSTAKSGRPAEASAPATASVSTGT